MSLLDFDALRATPRKSEPYDYLVVRHFVPADSLARVIADFPKADTTGSLPLSARCSIERASGQPSSAAA
mgnify:CR=1 FL=1